MDIRKDFTVPEERSWFPEARALGRGAICLPTGQFPQSLRDSTLKFNFDFLCCKIRRIGQDYPIG